VSAERRRALDRGFLTYAEVAQRYKIAAGTLRWLVHERRIPHLRWSERVVRFPQAELERWLAARYVAVEKGRHETL
jgi:excisionase family DNA binding protein